MFKQLDSDGDGVLSEAEFTAARPDDVSEDMASNLYNSLDSDGSGFLSDSELSTFLNGKA
jgi:Ca2+-binding EF-hand superfamily protein